MSLSIRATAVGLHNGKALTKATFPMILSRVYWPPWLRLRLSSQAQLRFQAAGRNDV